MAIPLSLLARKIFVLRAPGAAPTVPALIWEAPPDAGRESGHWEMTASGQSPTRPRAGEPLVFPVEKVPGLRNPFAMGVTVGRVETNDIVIDDGSVSRFHAWLQRDERTGQWALTDAESKNGTWVDGKQAGPRERIVLRDGAALKFGDVTLTFMLPERLYAFVEQRFALMK